MLGVALHAAFDRAIAQESWVAADTALRGIDPLLRLVVRRKIKHAIERADRSTITELPAHRLRLAALIALGKRAELDADDVPGVEAAYSALGAAPQPKRGAWFSLGIVLGVALLVSAVIFGVKLLRPFDPTDTPQGEIIGKSVSEFVVAAADRNDPERIAIRSELARGSAEKALGIEASKKLSALFDSAEQLAKSSAATPEALNVFQARTVQFNQALREQKLPYFIDAEPLIRGERIIPLLMSSYIERERVFESAGKQIRAVHLWRLDQLNVRFSYLGYTRPHTPAAIVLLDQSEQDLVDAVLPALAPKETMHLVDDDTREREPWAAEIETAVAQALRRDVKPDAALTQVANLVARRRILIRNWRAHLRGQGFQLVAPRRLIPEHDYQNDLEIRISRSELREWRDLHGSLLEATNLTAFLALRDQVTSSTERHEVQHRIEYARDLVPVPDVLCRRLGLENHLAAPEGSLAERSKTELAAYLAQLASGKPHLATIAIAQLSVHLLNRYQVGGPYSYAALALFELIAHELGIDVEALIGTGIIRPRNSAGLIKALLERQPAEIQAAARRAYATSFGQPLPEVRLLEEHENKKWRH